MRIIFFIFSIFNTLTIWAHVDTELESIEVFDHSETQSLVDFIPSATKLRGRELQKRRQTSIGDTLQNEAGVTSTNFGPSSGRPVIRGLDGDRVRVLQNSLGTLDASTQSLDHAIPVDTLTIEQMEIVRGPMSLLYGPSAVGGVVNLVTNRIHTRYEEGFFSQALIQGESAVSGLSSALHLNYGKKNIMYHIDGSTRNLTDQRIAANAQGGPTDGKKKGKIPNSANQQDNIAVGVSHVVDRGHYGISFNHFNTNYGTIADNEVTIGMIQNRAEFHSEWRPESSTFKKIKFRSAQSDYYHKEIEGEVTGTIFRNRGNESRLEGVTKGQNIEGIIGLQTQIFDFSAKGEEAFLPESLNSKLAIFSFHEMLLNQKNSVSAGARVEHSKIEKKTSTNFGSSDERNFTGLNGSLGHQYKFDPSNTLSSSFSYTERSPNFQELFSKGKHVATSTYEKGKASLKKEKAYALELNFKNQVEKTISTFSAYTQIFKDYISLNPTGEVDGDSGYDIYSYNQIDALFYGVDFDLRRELGKYRQGVWNSFTKFDWVRAKDTDSGNNLPRISPPRFSMGIEYVQDSWSADIEAQYVAHQTKTAAKEKSTDDYALTNIGYSYNFVTETRAINLFARVRNIFDVEARNHVSTLKELAPLPGRNFIVGAQIQL